MNVSPEDLRPRSLIQPGTQTPANCLPGSLKDRLYRDYLDDPDATPDSLAVKHGIPVTEVALMFRQGGWVQTKQAFLATSQDAQELIYSGIVAKERAPVARRNLEIGKALEDRVMATIEAAEGEVLDPRALKNLAEAANAAVQIRARVVGLTEKVAADSVAKAQAANPQTRAALLVIGARPIGAAPIDVTAEVKETRHESDRNPNDGLESGAAGSPAGDL